MDAFIDLTVLTAPAETPVDLASTKEWLRVDGTDQDATITGLIEAATRWAESYTHASFVARTNTVAYARFPGRSNILRVPYAPIVSVDEIRYTDAAGDPQTMAPSDVQIVSAMLGYIAPVAGVEWPTDVQARTRVEFDVTCGYGAEADVPDTVKTAIHIAVAQMFENRQDTMPTATSSVQTKASMALLQSERRHFGV